MASASSLSLLGFKQLSVHLVDCLKTPTDPRLAIKLEPEDLVLDLKEPCLVDCMKPPGPNGHMVDLAAQQSHISIKVELEDDKEQFDVCENGQHINTELDQKPDWCDTNEGRGASECDDEDLNCEETKTEETDELQLSHAVSLTGTQLVIEEDGGDSDGVVRPKQDYRSSECLKTAVLSSSEERQEETDVKSQNRPSDDITTPKPHGADVEASEPEGGGKNKGEMNQQEGACKARHHHCEHCGKSFARRSNVIRHQRRHCSMTGGAPSQPESERTEQETYSFDECSSTSCAKPHLRLHVHIHTENRENHGGKETSEEAPRERRHACKQCSKSFYLLHTLRQHLLTHTGEKSYSCKVCGKQFGREGTLKEHQVIHTGEKPFKCEQCGKTCARRGDLKIHMLSHSDERPYRCTYCGKSFKYQAKLKQHERVHTGEKPYLCKLCPKQFRTHMSLTAHQYTHSGEKPFKCNLCPKAFSIRNNLKKHQRIHTGEKPYSCSHCGKDFRLLQHLVIHERGHTGERPYRCDKCGKGYAHSSGLKTHQSTHEEKPPHCSACGRDFAELAALTGHECGQLAEKPHSCSQCGKRFSQMSNLKTHQLVHTGEKPYRCKECGKQFNHKSNLTKHERIHTGEKPFECERCKRGFRLLQHLINHRLTHTKKDARLCI
ncbi:zinc finger protein 2 homolog isoform X2 [Chelmon rostratus]|nr:zinc finger protein 2 homolog isoform X2 [Chelmon rostratus]